MIYSGSHNLSVYARMFPRYHQSLNWSSPYSLPIPTTAVMTRNNNSFHVMRLIMWFNKCPENNDMSNSVSLRFHSAATFSRLAMGTGYFTSSGMQMHAVRGISTATSRTLIFFLDEFYKASMASISLKAWFWILFTTNVCSFKSFHSNSRGIAKRHKMTKAMDRFVCINNALCTIFVVAKRIMNEHCGIFVSLINWTNVLT